MFPEYQQRLYRQVHGDAMNKTLRDMATFMDDFDASPKRVGSNEDQNNKPRHKQRHHSDKNTKYQYTRRQQTQEKRHGNISRDGQGNQHQQRAKDSDPCPVHQYLGIGNHKWGDCRYNPSSKTSIHRTRGNNNSSNSYSRSQTSYHNPQQNGNHRNGNSSNSHTSQTSYHVQSANDHSNWSSSDSYSGIPPAQVHFDNGAWQPNHGINKGN